MDNPEGSLETSFEVEGGAKLSADDDAGCEAPNVTPKEAATRDTNNDDDEEEEDDDDIYEVESILQERTKKGVKEYFVRWKGFGPEHDTWEPEDNLNCDDIIEEFRRQSKSATKKNGTAEKRKRIQKKNDQDDEDENPACKKGSKRGRPRKLLQKQPQERKREKDTGPKTGTKEPPLVIKCKTIFKKHLIQNCVKSEDRRNPGDDNSPDVVVKYFLRYDIDSGEFFVGNIKVLVDEETKCLRCAACAKTYGSLTIEQKLIPGKTPLQFWQMCRDMKLHIIGRHLEGFTCNLCDEPYGFHTRGASHYYHHMSQFHKGHRANVAEQTKGGLEENAADSCNQNQETSHS